MTQKTDIELYSFKNKVGRPRIFKSPEEMAFKWDEYVSYCFKHPLFETVVQKRKITRDEEIVEKVKVPHIRPLTLSGFCVFACIDDDTLKNYEKIEEFFGITTHIRKSTYDHKFNGAACGFYNANIIARDLGLNNPKEEDKPELKITIEHI